MRDFHKMILSVIKSRKTQEADIHRALVESLYASPASLAIGAMTGLAISVTLAVMLRSPVMWVNAAIISAIALGRTLSAVFYYQQMRGGNASSHRLWGMVYELGAWAYAAMLGVQSLLTLLYFNNPTVHILSVTMATGYAAGIAGRNAGRVEIAIGQVCLALVPTVIGLWLVGGIAYYVLGLLLLVMVQGLAEISRTTHNIVVEALRGKRQKSQLAAKYERLARHDSLTRIENRMAMQMRLRDALENRAPDGELAILWLDIDRFKEVNDSQGHIVGDALLVNVSEKITAVLGDCGHIARFGGDEFVVLCPNMGLEQVRPIANSILGLFERGMDVGPHNLPVTISMGIAIGPHDGLDADELLQHADLALYEAKTSGRNRAVPFTRSMKERFDRAHEIEQGLRKALTNDELEIWYQPIFDVKTGEIRVCEALMRWTHPLLGEVSPTEFIQVAETVGLIEEMTRWAIKKACKEAKNWPEHIRVAVNISPVSLRSGDLPTAIISALLENEMSPRRLELEVTESIFMNDDGHTHQILRDLRKIGLRMVLDDFGTGYSSLSYLRSYHFDGVKIDRSFFENITHNREDQAIVWAVGHIAAALGMEMVAEGIETVGQLDYVRAAHIHNVQGFLMSPARSASDIAKMVGDGVTIEGAMSRRLDELKARCA